MLRIRNPMWKEDIELRGRLEELVRRRYSRSEILTIVKKQYPQYAWSIGTLAIRLDHFSIKYINYDISINEVRDAVSNELDGPGCKLGYRAMTQKIREIHKLNVPRDIVYDMMKDIDPEGLESRGGVGVSRKRKRNKRFISPVSYFLIFKQALHILSLA